MGENFLRLKNGSFRRQLSSNFQHLVSGSDLFRDCKPEDTISVVAALVDLELRPGTKLWLPTSDDGIFYSGAQPAARVDSDSLARVRLAACGRVLVAQVEDVDSELDLVKLTIGTPK